MKVLNRDDVRAANDRKIVAVPTPEWGADTGVYVRSISVRERERLEAPVVKTGGKGGLENFRARVTVLATCTEDGTRVFADADADWLADKAASVIERICEAAMEASGMTDKAAAVAAGNSEGEPGGASSSGSPSVSGTPPQTIWPTS